MATSALKREEVSAANLLIIISTNGKPFISCSFCSAQERRPPPTTLTLIRQGGNGTRSRRCAQPKMEQAVRAAAGGVATRAGAALDLPRAALALPLGYTGAFTVIAEHDGGITVALQAEGGAGIGPSNVVWYRQGGAPRRWTDSGRGWFPHAYCMQDPELGAEKARQAAQSFDGHRWGLGFLIFQKGAPNLRVPHPDESESWAFGMLLDQDAAAAEQRPVVGWCLATCHGGPAQCSSGAARAERDFDGRCHGSDHLSLRVGDVLAPMQHSAAADGWCFGALLLDRESLTASPPELLPPQGLFGTYSGAIAWLDDPPLIQGSGTFHGRAPRGSGVIALCCVGCRAGSTSAWQNLQGEAKLRSGRMSFPKGARNKSDGESILECARREWYEETGIALSRVRFLPGAHLDDAHTGTRYLLAPCGPPALSSDELDACGKEPWKPPREDISDDDPIESAQWVRVEDVVQLITPKQCISGGPCSIVDRSCGVAAGINR
ncbi:NUDIX domain-containing protein [bacterium]|nr:NUDIX domain-containing protein [bacterium]